jgi:protoporphyrin/coproporphyrin ferrochelatase
MRTGIILTTYGEPQRNSFAEQWIYSYRILKGLTRKIAPIPAPLLPIIATARARGRVRMWNQHSFNSPLEPLHQQTARALEDELSRRGGEVPVVCAYEFRRPLLDAALAALHERGCERAVVVPMYMADGDFTHGMTRFALADAVSRQPPPAPGHWHEPGRICLCSLTASEDAEMRLARTVAAYCLEEMERRGVPTPAQQWAVLLAAHGTVVTSPPEVDNGLQHFGRVLIEVKRLLNPHVGLVRIGWLNHTRGGRWTTPTVGEALSFVQERGFENVVYFPWGFTTDNAETALEGRVAIGELERPLARVEYLEALNAHEPFVKLIADCVELHLEGSGGITRASGGITRGSGGITRPGSAGRSDAARPVITAQPRPAASDATRAAAGTTP